MRLPIGIVERQVFNEFDFLLRALITQINNLFAVRKIGNRDVFEFGRDDKIRLPQTAP